MPVQSSEESHSHVGDTLVLLPGVCLGLMPIEISSDIEANRENAHFFGVLNGFVTPKTGSAKPGATPLVAWKRRRAEGATPLAARTWQGYRKGPPKKNGKFVLKLVSQNWTLAFLRILY